MEGTEGCREGNWGKRGRGKGEGGRGGGVICAGREE